MDSEIFEKLPPTKLFFRLAIPSMITMAFGALYQIADGLFVGRFIGEDALAAVNLIMPIIMIVFGFANLIATGASVRISVLLAEKNREEASQVFTFTLKVIFLISCVVGAVGFIFAEPLVRSLAPGATELAIEYGITYTRVYAAFSPLMLIYHALRLLYPHTPKLASGMKICCFQMVYLHWKIFRKDGPDICRYP